MNTEQDNSQPEDVIAQAATETPADDQQADRQPDPAARVAELEAAVADLRDRLLRAVAETENTRKRLEKERQDTAKYAVSNFARGLLSVADNLRRALDAIPEDARAADTHLHSIYTGVEATERELLRSFDAAGIKKIEPLDQPFDANFHEVMFEADVAGKPAGTIVQLVEAGYIIHDRLLRPARVGVARGDKAQSAGSTVDRQV